MGAGFRELLRTRTVLTVAHRGASAYAPENTIEAFDLAVRQGADVLELDVHLTRDGEVVVIHDDHVDRTTNGRGDVRAMTLAEIRGLDAGGWFGERWRGARVPVLADVMERFGGRTLIDIEIKAGVMVRWLQGDVCEDPAVSVLLARRVLEAVERSGALPRVVVSSFGMDALRWVRRTYPGVATQRSVLSFDVAADCGATAQEGIDIISPQVYAAIEANVAAAHRAGLAVHIYAADGDETLRRLIDLGVDGIKTNRPDRLRALLAERRGT